jgi:hypothetical protein
VEKTLQIRQETLYHRGRTSRTAVQKTPEYRLKKNKFTLSSFETSHPSIVLAFRTLFMLSTKAKFTLLFQKRVPYIKNTTFVRILKSHEF